MSDLLTKIVVVSKYDTKMGGVGGWRFRSRVVQINFLLTFFDNICRFSIQSSKNEFPGVIFDAESDSDVHFDAIRYLTSLF